MKWFLILSLSLLSFWSKADQLAYLSKSDAERAAKFIKTQKALFLYCGCCDNDTPQEIYIKEVNVRFTNYEEYYEVVITAVVDGVVKEIPLDLAYVWYVKRKKYQTIGRKLALPHDICNQFPDSKK